MSFLTQSGHWDAFAERELWNIGRVRVTLIRLDVRRADHLAPLLGFVCDQFSEIGRRAPEDDAAQIGQLGLQLRFGEARIDLPVELVDDRGGRIPGCGEAEKPARLIAWHEFAYRRQVR